MYLVLAKGVASDKAVIVPADIEHHAVAAIAQQIGSAKGLLNVGGVFQSAYFTAVSQSAKAARLRACRAAKSSTVCRLIR